MEGDSYLCSLGIILLQLTEDVRHVSAQAFLSVSE